MAVERRKVEKPKVYKVTVEDLYKAACTRSEPCGAHIKTVDQMIKRLERAAGGSPEAD
jgi:hypothetical protein